MKTFGERILIKATKSKWVRIILKNFKSWVSYHEYAIFLNEVIKSNRYFIQVQVDI